MNTDTEVGSTDVYNHGGGRPHNSDGFVFLHYPFKKYIFQVIAKKQVSKHTHTHSFNLEVKMVEILTDLNWKWKCSENRPL